MANSSNVMSRVVHRREDGTRRVNPPAYQRDDNHVIFASKGRAPA